MVNNTLTTSTANNNNDNLQSMVILNGMTAMVISHVHRWRRQWQEQSKYSKSVSSIPDDSDSEDTVPGNVDDRMSAELDAHRSSKTEPIQTDPLQFWKNKESTYPNVAMQAQTSVFVRNFSAMRAHVQSRWRNCQQTRWVLNDAVRVCRVGCNRLIQCRPNCNKY